MSDEGSFLVVSPPADLPWVAPLALYGGAIQGRLAMPKDAGGLWLYWNTARETAMGVTNPHKALLSPWVVSASVFVYDTNALIWNEFVPGNARTRRFHRVRLPRDPHRDRASRAAARP